MKMRSTFETAMEHLDRGEAHETVRIGEQLISSEDKDIQLIGYVCRALGYEHGGEHLPADINKAIQDFRHVAVKAPHALAFNNLARSFMKQGPGGFTEALRYLQEARATERIVETELGFGEYYRDKPDPDYGASQRHFLSAALQGSFHGFFGYSEVSRLRGQNVRAMLMDAVRILIGPILAIFIGNKTQSRF